MDPRTLTIDSASRYFAEVGAVLNGLPGDTLAGIIARLDEARWKGQAVFTCGNGGSAATAIHFAGDLAKGARAAGKPPFKALSLCENISLVTAWANDECYDCIFAERLAPWVRPGDVLIAISGSGNSPNVLKAVEVARATGATTIGLAGFDGGRLRQESEICLAVPCHSMEQVEDIHLVICHFITTYLRGLPLPPRAEQDPVASAMALAATD